MHWAYASPAASGSAALDDEPPAGAVVADPEAALGTVGGLDPVEQAATVTASTTAVAAQSCNRRIVPPCRQARLRASFLGDRYALAGISDVCD
jgi:hypothetical protein